MYDISCYSYVLEICIGCSSAIYRMMLYETTLHTTYENLHEAGKSLCYFKRSAGEGLFDTEEAISFDAVQLDIVVATLKYAKQLIVVNLFTFYLKC